MKDPFLPLAIPELAKTVQPLADWLQLPTLSLHIHEVLGAALLYTVIFWPISPLVSGWLAPKAYYAIPKRKRVNWDAHVVSMVQCLFINTLAIWVALFDESRKTMGWEERVWAYTESSAMVQALAAGYFLWDLIVTSMYLDVFGIGTLAHAVAALIVYSLGFRPIVNYYSTVFILWELSTPFLNIHWFMDKLGRTGSKLQLYNGLMLLFSFFTARLLFGTYSSVCVLQDLWMASNNAVSMEKRISVGMVHVTDGSRVPSWLMGSYLLSNLTLNYLNFYWFYKMIKALRRRFEPAQGKAAVASPNGSAMATGTSKASTPRRRKA
ncbi:DUF887-domain-containing protein [Sarocladium strictum]